LALRLPFLITINTALSLIYTLSRSPLHKALQFSVSTSNLLGTDLNTETITLNHFEIFLSSLTNPYSINLHNSLRTCSILVLVLSTALHCIEFCQLNSALLVPFAVNCFGYSANLVQPRHEPHRKHLLRDCVLKSLDAYCYSNELPTVVMQYGKRFNGRCIAMCHSKFINIIGGPRRQDTYF
jgi:hypothetical protein